MPNIKKIIFFIPNIEQGGIEKNFLVLTKYFTNKNYEVEVFYSKLSQNILSQIDKRVNLKKSKNYFKIFNFIFSNRVSNSINCFFYFIFKLKKEKNSIIISMQDHPFAIMLGKIKKINCILRIANHPEASLKFFNNKIFFFIKLFIKIFFYKYANGIICNSRSSFLFLKKKIDNNIVNIYNSIIVKKIIKNKKRKNFLLSVGRLEKQKNFDGLIDAFNIVLQEFPHFKLIIIGSGTEKNKLIKKLIKLNILNKVIFKNFIRPDHYFSTSKIFILNSFFEGMPNVILESLSYKCPVISTNCDSGPREILKNGKYGYLVPVNKYQLLAKKIKFALNNYQIIKKKTDNAFLNLKEFSYEKQCKKYEIFINSFFNS
jgi:glycosyltransferase involved in cell wall biosynthesis